VLSIGAFYLAGLLALTTVRQEAGIAAAEEADEIP
jgi:hypothetical protein